MTFFQGATSRFSLLSPQGYNIPKPKFMYYVNFVTSNLTQQNSANLNFAVKRIDRLQMSYEIMEMNQYNKKRLVQGKLQYGPLSFSLYDQIDGTAAKFIEAYNRFYYGDFSQKNNSSWIYDVVGSNFESSPNWGLQSNQTPNSSTFIDRIEIYEMYNQVYSQINFINPKFTNIEMQGVSADDSAGNEISVGVKYEGVVFQAIAQPVTQQLADMFGLPLTGFNLTGLLGGLNIPGFDISSGVGLPGQSIFSGIANIVNNELNGGRPSTTFNTVNSILNGATPQILSSNTTFQTVNGVFGSAIGGSVPPLLGIQPVNTLSQILPGVSSQVQAGQPVRDVTGAVFDVSGFTSNLGF